MLSLRGNSSNRMFDTPLQATRTCQPINANNGLQPRHGRSPYFLDN
jgi:hypothetical protein